MKIKKAAFTVVVVLVPLLFFGAVEGVLRLAGVGESEQHLFIELPGRAEYVALNPGYVARYFNGFRPGVAFNPFTKEKRDDSFRVFVLGGSSAAGFPYQFYYGFPTKLSSMLETAAPDQHVEVVNLAMTAVNSFTLWDIVDEVAAQKPDAIVIYAGHNEYYGAFGAGSSINRLGNSLVLKRLVLRLKKLVLYRWMEGVLSRSADPGSSTSAERTMMAQVVRDATIDLDTDVYHTGVRQFQANMKSVFATFTKRGIPVYVGTVTSNLRSQAPLGDNAQAAQNYVEGLKLLEDEPAQSRAAFLDAKEHDNIRFRAPEAINAVLRDLSNSDEVLLIEIQRAIAEQSDYRVEGDDLFTDHLHLNARGYEAIARTFADELMELSNLRVQNRVPFGSARLDPVGAAHAEIQIARLKGGYPFNKTSTPQEEAAALSSLLRARSAAGLGDSLAVEVVKNPGSMSRAVLSAARLAREMKDTTSALLYYRAVLNWQPFNDVIAGEALAFGLQSQRHDEAVGDILQFVTNQNGTLDHINALAAIRIRQNRLDEASALLDAAEHRDPQSPTMAFNKARLLVIRGDTISARRYFELSQMKGNQ